MSESDDTTPSDELFDWIADRDENPTGCVFARMLAGDPQEHRWHFMDWEGQPFEAPAIERLNYFLAEAASNDYEAAHITFAEVNGPEEVGQLVRALGTHSRWRVDRITPKDAPAEPPLLLGLRWILPDDTHISWALGFADFDPMPRTRRAPHTTLVPSPGRPEDVWWLGFDCAHAGDLQPAWKIPGNVYRDESYVRKETARLAAQLGEMV